MTLGDFVILLVAVLLLVVALGSLVLSTLGFSFGKGALITTTFLLLGFWNPVGWIVLGLCAWLQVKENRGRLLARQAAPRSPRSRPLGSR